MRALKRCEAGRKAPFQCSGL